MKRLSLQWRITILTAVILFINSAALTAASMINAERSFVTLIEESISVQPVEPLPTIPYSDETTLEGKAGTPALAAKQKFDMRSILYCVLFSGIGSVAAYYVAGKALEPLRKLSGAIKTTNEDTLSQRLPQVSTKDEVGTLTDAFNEMLERLDDAFLRQKRFTANAAHELKTPLAILKTGMQVISDDPETDLAAYRSHTKETLDTIDRMASMVDDLLFLASAGESNAYEKEEVWLTPLFEAIQSELFSILEQRECTTECGELSVTGDSALLYRAFFNLMENACKYGCQGGHIWIHAGQAGEMAHISIKDDGPGICKEHLPYIFDAFYRVDKSRSREIGGSGLGLSIVKSLIESSGGQITAESDGKNGCCFLVSLPIYKKEEP